MSDRGWSRQWSSNPLSSWIHYHSEMLNFHTGLTITHPYQANPWSWLIMGRPTSFFYASPDGCSTDNCAQEVLALGTPILWWVGTIAIAVVVGYWITRPLTAPTTILVLQQAIYPGLQCSSAQFSLSMQSSLSHF